jgi:acetylglutamate kinase
MRVLKIGGNELDRAAFLGRLAEEVRAIDEPVVIVHGGGRAIADLQARLGLKTVKVEGLRVTDPESLRVVEMVLSGSANKQIVAALVTAGVDALGLSGVDRGLLRCEKKAHPTADLGLVGEIVQVQTDVLMELVATGVTPVVSPISLGLDGRTYNINADQAAGAVAQALGADLLDFVSNVPGVLQDGHVLPTLTAAEAERLIETEVIREGMVPKVRAALTALEQGVRRARIVDLDGLAAGGGTVFVPAEPGRAESPQSAREYRRAPR